MNFNGNYGFFGLVVLVLDICAIIRIAQSGAAPFKGEGLEWQCTYQHDTDKTFCFGPDATIQEHCILFGSYYPTDTTQEAITCLHDKDVNGNDVTSLHIVH
ncbi:MAG: hypothetical protein E6J77_10850 [Deltaproteobacteria bacterium]|nr:MAG: hypothetical protein E6J77_10850 [Deltaproteobacteria bacterium]